jgi:sugar lactone lactonase YvrE
MMKPRHRSIAPFTLFAAALVLAADVTSAHAGSLTFDPAGNLFVADGQTVSKVTVDGTKSIFPSGLKDPLGLAVDSKGNLFVSDVSSDSISKFTPEGKKSTFVSGLGNAIDMAFDEAGNLFVVEQAIMAGASGRSILRFTPDGTKSTFTSAVGAVRPSGLAVDRSGNVYVSNDHSILKFDPSGTPSTFTSDLVSPDKLWE